MHYSFTPLPPAILLFSLICLLGIFTAPSPGQSAQPPICNLKVTFVPDKHLLNGVATVEIGAGQGLALVLDGLNIDTITLINNGHEITLPQPPATTHLDLANDPFDRTLTIHYHIIIPPGSLDNLLNRQGITLTDRWHPLPLKKMLFNLHVQLPKGFSAISETDQLPLKQAGEVRFSFSQPVHAIHLAAGPYVVRELKIRDDLRISSWFFNEDATLSEAYLKSAASHILQMEALSPFPYGHYAIVANRLPSGLGMPTFTLLGQQALRLPFIKDTATALRHEITHSWFGNGIHVASDSGNWAEGLTSFLAELNSCEDAATAQDQRKQVIINYLSHVHQGTAIALQDFHSPSHRQPLADAVRGVGYQRGAMLFHELRLRLGETLFNQGLRRFIDNHLYQSASWQDIKNAFASVADEDISPFFEQYLERLDLPRISASEIENTAMEGRSRLNFILEQHTETPYDMVVPLMVRTGNQELYFQRRINQIKTEITLHLPDPATELIIDPGHDLLRHLERRELPPVLSRFLGAPQKTVIVSDGQWQRFAPLLDHFSNDQWNIISAAVATNRELSNPALLFLGSDNSAYRSLFGPPAPLTDGFTLNVRQHPLQPTGITVIVDSQSIDETRAATNKLSHYGRYSHLSFNQGRNANKSIQPTENGIHFILEPEPTGTPIIQYSLQDILNDLVRNRIVYVGERHDSMADHRLQFRIIQGLHRLDPNLIIGMEMFPQSSQPALNDYIQGRTTEREFLKASRYFEVWGYDWRFYREIFNFARRHQIPVMGLNLERSIVSQLFKDGHTDHLSPEIHQALPADRDLSLPGYGERLQFIFGMHNQGSGNFSGFIQSQGLWDETMAQIISDTLTDMPARKMVVLAGSQHTRPDSGIPPRVARQINVSQATVINLPSPPPVELKGFTDYIMFTEPIALKPSGKIGITLEQNKDGAGLIIRELSPQGKAKEAGVKEGEIILAIDNYPVRDMNDLRIAMLDARVGERLQITLQMKNGKPVERIVELSSLETIKPHP